MRNRLLAVDAAGLLRALGDLRRRRAARFRSRLVRETAREVLVHIVDRQPNETGRARRAWQAALAALSGEGLGSQETEGDAELVERITTTTVRIVNRVDYVRYVEYGTRRLAPRSMVRRSLAGTGAILSRLAPALVAEELVRS